MGGGWIFTFPQFVRQRSLTMGFLSTKHLISIRNLGRYIPAEGENGLGLFYADAFNVEPSPSGEWSPMGRKNQQNESIKAKHLVVLRWSNWISQKKKIHQLSINKNRLQGKYQELQHATTIYNSPIHTPLVGPTSSRYPETTSGWSTPKIPRPLRRDQIDLDVLIHCRGATGLAIHTRAAQSKSAQHSWDQVKILQVWKLWIL